MSDAELQSRFIFIDTNTYISKNFQFKTFELARLNNYIYSEDLTLLITDVNVREVKKHIELKSKEAYADLKQIRKSAMILRNVMDLNCAGIFASVSAEDICSRINAQFDYFIEGPNVKVIDVTGADVKEIFDDYFLEKPPFDQANKKSEFPDAFILSAINKLSKKRGDKLYVVSNDGDFKRYCARHDNLISLSTVDELIDIVVRNSEKLAVPAKFADEMYSHLEGEIKSKLEAILNNAEIDPPTDFEGGYDLQDIAIDYFEIASKSILEVSRSHAVYELKLNLLIAATFSVVDYERSPWDSEDRAYMFYLSNEYVISYSYSPTVILNISYEDGISSKAIVEDFDIEDIFNFNNAKSQIVSYKQLDYVDDEWGAEDEAEARELAEIEAEKEAGLDAQIDALEAADEDEVDPVERSEAIANAELEALEAADVEPDEDADMIAEAIAIAEIDALEAADAEVQSYEDEKAIAEAELDVLIVEKMQER